jgi:hypothetical protein
MRVAVFLTSHSEAHMFPTSEYSYFCGDRSVLIGKGTIMGQETLDVSERIGELPPNER